MAFSGNGKKLLSLCGLENQRHLEYACGLSMTTPCLADGFLDKQYHNTKQCRRRRIALPGILVCLLAGAW